MVQHREFLDINLKTYFLVPYDCIVCFLLAYYLDVISSVELFICTKQIICDYLGFELPCLCLFPADVVSLDVRCCSDVSETFL